MIKTFSLLVISISVFYSPSVNAHEVGNEWRHTCAYGEYEVPEVYGGNGQTMTTKHVYNQKSKALDTCSWTDNRRATKRFTGGGNVFRYSWFARKQGWYQEGLQQEKEKIDRKALPQPNFITREHLFIFVLSKSEYRNDAAALVREGDSRRNPVPLLANHKKFIRSALFLVNKNSG